MMSRRGLVSRAALAAYTYAQRSGFLTTRTGEAVFNHAYMFYKQWFEDRLGSLLRRRPELVSGGHVLDIGANIGYTALLLARFCDPPFRVVAFEPEPENVERLRRNVARSSTAKSITVQERALGRESGVAMLWRNSTHHGDHRIATVKLRAAQQATYSQVAMTSIDEEWSQHLNRGPISFIKIDVQGFEPEVFAGMGRLLSSQRRLTVVSEYDPALSESLGFDAASVPRLLAAEGFELFRLRRRGVLTSITAADISDRRDYFDLVAIRS